MIDGELLKTILEDIEKCDETEGNESDLSELVGYLVAKYSEIFPDFDKNIKIGVTSYTRNYNRELLNIKEKLKGHLIKNSQDRRTRLQIKILRDAEKIDRYSEMSDAKLLELYEDMVNYYHSKIRGFGNNLYGYDSKNEYYNSEILVRETIVSNLKAIKSKLKAFYDADCENELEEKQEPFINATFSNHNTNKINVDINIDIVYENAQKEINDNTTFSGEEIELLQEKLRELKDIVSSDESKRKKWDKAKDIFVFALDKGIDISLAFLPMMNFLK